MMTILGLDCCLLTTTNRDRAFYRYLRLGRFSSPLRAISRSGSFPELRDDRTYRSPDQSNASTPQRTNKDRRNTPRSRLLPFAEIGRCAEASSPLTSAPPQRITGQEELPSNERENHSQNHGDRRPRRRPLARQPGLRPAASCSSHRASAYPGHRTAGYPAGQGEFSRTAPAVPAVGPARPARRSDPDYQPAISRNLPGAGCLS